MLEIDASNATNYLRDRSLVSPSEDVLVQELSGGVSNIVMLVTPASGERFVIKQARAQLRVAQPWFCSVERVLREIDVLQICEHVLGAVSRNGDGDSSLVAVTPRLLFQDRENYLYGMSAAPPNHTTWKQELLAGHFSPKIAAACGALLGRLHAGTWHNAEVAERIADRAFFDDLRLDPYYRQVARVHADLKPTLDALVASVWEQRHCLVHGDFSPKNLLVWPDGLMLLDFEVGHYGDPAFDLGFFLAHLVLKTIYHRRQRATMLSLIESFWNAYWPELEAVIGAAECAALETRAIQNLGGCLLARVDGKSRVEYIQDAQPVRNLGRRLLQVTPPNAHQKIWPTLVGQIQQIESLLNDA